MTTVLALDFGSTTGWAVGAPRSPRTEVPFGVQNYALWREPVSGTWNIAPRRGESPGMRYVHLRRKLQEILAAYPDLKHVAYEQAHNRGGAPTAYGHGCEAILQAWCEDHKIEFTPVHSSTLKKYATGKGNAKKDLMMHAATVKGWKFADDNEADALWILDYALNEVIG